MYVCLTFLEAQSTTQHNENILQSLKTITYCLQCNAIAGSPRKGRIIGLAPGVAT